MVHIYELWREDSTKIIIKKCIERLKLQEFLNK